MMLIDSKFLLPPADPARLAQPGRDDARVQHEMDLLLGEWEGLQG
jgi:hypothetical protein